MGLSSSVQTQEEESDGWSDSRPDDRPGVLFTLSGVPLRPSSSLPTLDGVSDRGRSECHSVGGPWWRDEDRRGREEGFAGPGSQVSRSVHLVGPGKLRSPGSLYSTSVLNDRGFILQSFNEKVTKKLTMSCMVV